MKAGIGIARKGKVIATLTEKQERQEDIRDFQNSHCVHKIEVAGGLWAPLRSCCPPSHKHLPACPADYSCPTEI